jgi:4-hydroxy-3-methylbut-2-en-1-yl diphosphate synthase IspG/GcpE
MQNQRFCILWPNLITENQMSIYPPKFTKEVRLQVDEAKKNRKPMRIAVNRGNLPG